MRSNKLHNWYCPDQHLFSFFGNFALEESTCCVHSLRHYNISAGSNGTKQPILTPSNDPDQWDSL
jgi:hypothetical protein